MLSARRIEELCDRLNSNASSESKKADSNSHLTFLQVAELRRSAVRRIMRDLEGAAEDQAEHWAECYLDGKEDVQTYLDVLDWHSLDAQERARIGLSFDPRQYRIGETKAGGGADVATSAGIEVDEFLSVEQKRLYFVAGCCKCPHCGSKSIEGTGSRNSDGDWHENQIKCIECGAEWNDIYTLTDVEGSQAPTPEP